MLTSKLKLFTLGAIITLSACLMLTGCSSQLRPLSELKHRSPSVAYKTAQRAMKLKRYDEAIKYYEFISATYPFSPYAQQANLEIIYAYYKQDELPLGITASDRYIHLYPRSAHVDYAYYMKGLLNFLSGVTWTQRYLPLEMAQRDLDSMQRAFNNFNELIHFFPRSRYAPDAHYRMIYIRNLLAQRELDIATFYYKRRHDVAAANRASNVVKHFSRTPQVRPALQLMVKAYKRMGDKTLADKTQRLLNYNYK